MLRLRRSHLLQCRDVLCDAGECRGQHARRRDHYRGRQPREAAPPAVACARHPAAAFTATRDCNADAGTTFSGSMTLLMTFSGSTTFRHGNFWMLPVVPKST
jgi:hypothetical protein